MEIIDNKCPSCGASLEYNIETQNWKCKHCRKEYGLSEVKKIKHSSRKNINELICPTCNAKLMVNDNIISTKCIYCRNDVIVEKTKDEVSYTIKELYKEYDCNDRGMSIEFLGNKFKFTTKAEHKEFYKKLIKHDKIKDDYAKKNNWNLIRIPYWDFDNIEEILYKNIIQHE